MTPLGAPGSLAAPPRPLASAQRSPASPPADRPAPRPDRLRAPALALLVVSAAAAGLALPGVQAAVAGAEGWIWSANLGLASSLGVALARPDPRGRARRRRLPSWAGPAVLGLLAGLLAEALSRVIGAWSTAAWPTAGWTHLAVVGVAALPVGGAAGASTGVRAAWWGALAGSAAALAVVSFPGAALHSGDPRWLFALGVAAASSLAAVLAPGDGLRLRVKGGSRAGLVVDVPPGGLRIGSSKRWSDLYLPESEGVSPRHAEIRPGRTGWTVVSTCAEGHGVRVRGAAGRDEVPRDGRMRLETGDRIELWGAGASACFEIHGRLS